MSDPQPTPEPEGRRIVPSDPTPPPKASTTPTPGFSPEAIAARWRGVYAVDGIGKVAPGELPPDIAQLLAALEASEREYNALAEHHRQCELAGTELCEAAKETIIYSADGPSRDRLNVAMMTWDAHQWPALTPSTPPDPREDT